MAVKIIDPTPDPELIKRVSCRFCGARLEYMPIDIKERHGRDMGGGPDGAEWIVCPQCNKEVILKRW